VSVCEDEVSSHPTPTKFRRDAVTPAVCGTFYSRSNIMSTFNLKGFAEACVAIGKQASKSTTKLVADFGEISIADSAVSGPYTKNGSTFLFLSTLLGNFSVGIDKHSAVGASRYQIKQFVMLEDLKDSDGNIVLDENGATAMPAGKHFMKAYAVAEEEE
jgi:hypothetical protein